MKNKTYFFYCVLFLCGVAIIASCARKGCTDPNALNYDEFAQRDSRDCTYGDKYVELKIDAILNYADIAFAMYSDAYSQSLALQTKVEEFVAAPTAARYNKCKIAWQDAHTAYELCEVFRFSGGPIDQGVIADRINGWPINAGFIDYTTEGDSIGIINQITDFPVINLSTLNDAMQVGSKENISVGFHAIEFLLWGEDTAAASTGAAGIREFTDYVGDSIANRRGVYLSLISNQLASDIELIMNDWDPLQPKNYRHELLELSENKALKGIMSGMATMLNQELAFRNMLHPMDQNNEFYEQSRFSDQSYFDISAMYAGFMFVYEGEYTPISGVKIEGESLKSLLTESNIDIATKVSDMTKRIDAEIQDIPVPFDYQITLELPSADGPIAIAIRSLQDLAVELQDAGAALGVSVKKEM